MGEHGIRVEDLRLLGGRPCIDFVNTVENRAGTSPVDVITDATALVAWARHAGILDAADGERLLRHADEPDSGAQRTLVQALRLREALHRVLLAVARQHDPPAADLRMIERVYQRALAHAHLTPAGARLAWDWRSAEPRLEHVLWMIAMSAVELLTNGDLKRVKVCDNQHGCGWLFYDGSKNASRRWCSMEGCGSQVKMRRQYAKRRAQSDRREAT